ncbi:hypothetical protein L2E82_01188 [Cichorium intybus]|uniref:Uncharacterized protein n=1 Tax=Cichorium intybus TaxID=13427 RepID=A0ACB9GY97_CICIN|nr:hypothetical protein L2E82_01188 [Cichorium intybus]
MHSRITNLVPGTNETISKLVQQHAYFFNEHYNCRSQACNNIHQGKKIFANEVSLLSRVTGEPLIQITDVTAAILKSIPEASHKKNLIWNFSFQDSYSEFLCQEFDMMFEDFGEFDGLYLKMLASNFNVSLTSSFGALFLISYTTFVTVKDETLEVCIHETVSELEVRQIEILNYRLKMRSPIGI